MVDPFPGRSASLYLTVVVGALLSHGNPILAANRFPLQLSVELVDTTGLDARTLGGLRNEVSSIYGPSGVGIQWLEVGLSDEPPHFARVYLMHEIPPSLKRRLQVFGGGSPMAVALGRSGSVSGPTIYISRAAVARKATADAVVEPEPHVLGQALGRVAAHELAHRFLLAGHRRYGLLKAELSQYDLIGASSSELFMTDEQIQQLRKVACPTPSFPPLVAGSVNTNESPTLRKPGNN